MPSAGLTPDKALEALLIYSPAAARQWSLVCLSAIRTQVGSGSRDQLSRFGLAAESYSRRGRASVPWTIQGIPRRHGQA